MEYQDVFEATHGHVLELLAAGCLDGVRLDDIDGLFDPLRYLWNLQRGYLLALGRQTYERIATAESPTWDEIRQFFLASLAGRLDLPPLVGDEATLGIARGGPGSRREPRRAPPPIAKWRIPAARHCRCMS